MALFGVRPSHKTPEESRDLRPGRCSKTQRTTQWDVLGSRGDDLGVGLDGVPETNDDYDTGLLLCRALSCAGGFVIRIMFRTNTVPPTDKAGVYDWSITSIIRSRWLIPRIPVLGWCHSLLIITDLTIVVLRYGLMWLGCCVGHSSI